MKAPRPLLVLIGMPAAMTAALGAALVNQKSDPIYDKPASVGSEPAGVAAVPRALVTPTAIPTAAASADLDGAVLSKASPTPCAAFDAAGLVAAFTIRVDAGFRDGGEAAAPGTEVLEVVAAVPGIDDSNFVNLVVEADGAVAGVPTIRGSEPVALTDFDEDGSIVTYGTSAAYRVGKAEDGRSRLRLSVHWKEGDRLRSDAAVIDMMKVGTQYTFQAAKGVERTVDSTQTLC